MTDKVMIIDGMNMFWRANMSWGKKESDKSEYVMIYNFFRNLRPLVEQFVPSKIFFVLEGHPKHRYEIYSEYKANRIVKTAEKKESREKFFDLTNKALELLKFLPITLCKANDYEADDVIATLAENMKNEDVTIISNDSDYVQLLQKGYNIKLYNPIKKSFVQPPDYFYLAWKCLRGDSADNIPSLMSDAKAEKLVKNPELLKKWMEIEENRANFSINKSLIEFAKIPLEEIVLDDGVVDFKSLQDAFKKMEFSSLLKEETWAKFCSTFSCVRF